MAGNTGGPSEPKKPKFSDSHDLSKYKAVFCEYYEKLSRTIPTSEMLPSLFSAEVITMEQKEQIQAKETSSLRARALLDGSIWGGINCDYPETFIRLLCVLRLHNPPCYALASEIIDKLNIPDDVVGSYGSCKFLACWTVCDGPL